MYDRVKKALLNNYVVMYNTGKDTYWRVRTIRGRNAFFIHNITDHIDLDNCVEEDFLFLIKA